MTRIRWFINAEEWPFATLALSVVALLGCFLLLLAAAVARSTGRL